MTKEEFLKRLPELMKDYNPASDVVDDIKNLVLLMIIGPSGVGKTSVINELGIKYVVGDTTRGIRPNEQNGEDYFFRKDYDQILEEIKKGRFLQVAVGSGGDFYATRASSFPKSGVGVMAVVADVIPIFRSLGFKQTISVFMAPPSYSEWMNRLNSHDLESDQLKKRLAEARRSFEFALSDKRVHFVLNDDLTKVVEQIQNIIEGQEDELYEHEAKKTAQEVLNTIK